MVYSELLLHSFTLHFSFLNKFLAPLPGRATVFVKFLELNKIFFFVTGYKF